MHPDHRCRRPDVAKEFAVGAPNFFPTINVRHKHACAHNVGQGKTCALQHPADLAQHGPGFRIEIHGVAKILIGSDRALDLEAIAGLNGAGISNDILPHCATRDIFPNCHMLWSIDPAIFKSRGNNKSL